MCIESQIAYSLEDAPKRSSSLPHPWCSYLEVHRQHCKALLQHTDTPELAVQGGRIEGE